MVKDAPWLKFYKDIPHNLDYPDITIYQALQSTAKKYPNLIAYEFLGNKANYTQFNNEVFECAQSLKAIGIKEDDVVTICLPNIPQAIIMFYAVNKIGAVSNMIHPL